MGVGVPIFFVVSGYCIAATAESVRRGRVSPARYFLRRFRRIFPPFWAVLALTAGLAAAAAACGRPTLVSDERDPIPHPASLTACQWLGNITLTETWRVRLTPDPYQLQFGPAWTLCYEEQFYAVCGLLLVIAPRRFYAGAAAVTLSTLAVVAYHRLRPDTAVEGFFFDGRWLLFASGVFVFYRVSRGTAAGARWVVPVLVSAVLAVLVLRYGVLPRAGTWSQRDRAFEYLVGFAFALLLALAHPWDGALVALRAVRPFLFCGQMCYSLYLVHWPVTKLLSHVLELAGVRGAWPTLLVTIPACLTVSVVLARGFYWAVERRFLNPPAGRVAGAAR
jgi:peptidoglycan/LPS O-acetylase OafA/YrhL